MKCHLAVHADRPDGGVSMSNDNVTVNETSEHKAEVVEDKTTSTLVDTLFDIGLAWAEFGVGQGVPGLLVSG